ncbi:probable disease resistance protein At4g27220 isoform X1 [Prosopis cineraria]|uniref:probable disease resistance protein At4g27220 isoform X1 n=1 Tax=Prosopis cineraria TaxID=364024 RepID=UPI00241041ED|nr:probable disease resistance protein At4g27220 isoform X1 [Prosopis cineraria]
MIRLQISWASSALKRSPLWERQAAYVGESNRTMLSSSYWTTSMKNLIWLNWEFHHKILISREFLQRTIIRAASCCSLLETKIFYKRMQLKNFRLEVLCDEESHRLFQMTNDDAAKDVELRDIATQVVESCAGLPMLIVAMAKLLKNREIYCWKDALNVLKKVDSGIMGDKIFPPLKYMYDCLPDHEVKQVFLLCGVLGTSISVNDLLKYVIGLGVFKHIKTIEGVRNRLQKVIDDLKASCFLLHSDAMARVIKMHDLLREVAISIASGDQHVFTRNVPFQDWPSGDFFKWCTQIKLVRCCIQTLPEKLDCPILKFLYLNSKDNPSLEIPNSFFEGMRNLGVLDLTGMIILSLPTSFAALTELKTLCLDQCSLEDISGIGALKNLEILSFFRSSMEEFPSEIAQLSHLRMLDLTRSGIEVILPDVVSKLTKLEELYVGNASIKWEAKSSTKRNKNASLVELKHLTSLITLHIQVETWILVRDIVFDKLERYKIVIGDKWEWQNDNNTSRLLKLKLDTPSQLEHGIKTLMESVEDLYLDELNGISNVLFQLNGKGFPRLKHLHIQNNGDIQCIISSTGRNQTDVMLFPKLETLMLHNLSMLKEICDGPRRVDSFGKLRVMKLKSCGRLKYVFLNSIVKNFSQLVEIEVSECHSVENIVSLESMNSGMIINKVEFIPLRRLALQYLPAIVNFCCSNIPTSFFDAKVSLSNLETLKLSSINLEKIWDDHQHSTVTSFRNLVNLIVDDCGSLQYLFSPFMVENMENLKLLEISKCHAMEEIIAIKGSNNEITLAQDHVVGFPKLEEMIVNDMKNLKRAWHYQFGRLKILEVNKCDKLETMFPSGYMLEALRNLEILRVRDCVSVEEIFQLTAADGMHTQEVTAQLKNLEISGLPKMKRIWNRDPQGLVRFSNLQLMSIKHCSKLEYIFPFSIAKDLPQLEYLELVMCGIKEVVLKKDGSIDETTIFELNDLISLILTTLVKLKGFYAGVRTLECQSL